MGKISVPKESSFILAIYAVFDQLGKNLDNVAPFAKIKGPTHNHLPQTG